MKKPAIMLIIIALLSAVTIFIAKGGFLSANGKVPADTAKHGNSSDNAVLGGLTENDGSDRSAVELSAEPVENDEQKAESLIYPQGRTVKERILTPEGYKRIDLRRNSFGEYLRNLPLKADGSKVVYYNGEIKPADVHVAVIDIDVGKRDLQQCADSVIRLRAEYLYGQGLYDSIHFNFTNGFSADYSKWIAGDRISVSGNRTGWIKGRGSAGTGYESFRSYLNMVFAYAGTLSLSQEMKNIPIEDMQPGDVFIKGGSPGHCVIVLDMAYNAAADGKRYIIAQGFMPAQDIHVLKNPANSDNDPWYALGTDEEIVTPEWTFTKDQLYRFME